MVKIFSPSLHPSLFEGVGRRSEGRAVRLRGLLRGVARLGGVLARVKGVNRSQGFILSLARWARGSDVGGADLERGQ